MGRWLLPLESYPGFAPQPGITVASPTVPTSSPKHLGDKDYACSGCPQLSELVDVRHRDKGQQVPGTSPVGPHDGRQPIQMGHPSGSSSGPGPVVPAGSGPQYKRSGAMSHLPCSSELRKSHSRSGRSSSDGQCLGQGSREPAGRDLLEGPHAGNLLFGSLGRSSPGLSSGDSHIGCNECQG